MISFLWHCPPEFRDWPLFMSGEGWWFWFCHDKIRALEYSYVLPPPPPPPPLSPSPQWQKISSQFFIAPAFILFLATTDPLSIPPVNPSLNPPSFPFPPPPSSLPYPRLQLITGPLDLLSVKIRSTVYSIPSPFEELYVSFLIRPLNKPDAGFAAPEIHTSLDCFHCLWLRG